MKNNFFFSAIVATSIACLVGCNPMQDVSVEEVANDLTRASFEKTETRSKTVFNDMCMEVVEWTVDAEKKQITVSGQRYGDGVDEHFTPQTFDYKQGELRPDGLGMYYSFAPVNGGEPLNVLYWGNSLIVKGDTISDASAPSVNLNKIANAFPNHKWFHETASYFVTHDTINKIDTIITTVRRPGPDGKPISVSDTTYKKVRVITNDTLGMTYHETNRYEFTRDESTLKNACKHVRYVQEYEVNADSTAMVPKGDALNEEFTYSWALSSIVSASRFVITAKGDKEEWNRDFRMSEFNIDKGTLSVGNNKCKLDD